MCVEHTLSGDRRWFLRGVAGIGSGLLLSAFEGFAGESSQPSQSVGWMPRTTAGGAGASVMSDLHVQGCGVVGSQVDGVIAYMTQLVASGRGNQALIESSGNERLDAALGHLLADMASKFEVRPGFAFYDDTNSPNALAMPKSYLANTRGTVLFGRSLLGHELSHGQNGDMSVMGICAHEFGHIVQYTHGIRDRLIARQETVKRVELHADFLAGYYIGRRGEEYKANQLIALGKAWEMLGDNHFSAPEHHGTPEERLEAMETGYRMAVASRAGLTEAIQGGLYYLRA